MTAIAPVARKQKFEYFDTDTLRLLQHGLTLRHRSGEWELDTPEGRVLVLSSPALPRVPRDMLGLVRAYTRDDELIRVATMREGGAAELRRGVDGRLVVPKRQPDSSARGVVLAYVRTQIAALASADLAVRRDQPDAVHRMRVAARRLRGVIGTFAPVLGGKKLLHELDGVLRWLGRELGPARDAEVQWARLIARLEALQGRFVVGPVRLDVDGYFEALIEDAKTQVSQALGTRRYVQLLNALDVLEVVLNEESPGRRPKIAKRPASKVLPRLVRAVADDVGEKTARAAALDAGPERDLAVHDLRKAASGSATPSKRPRIPCPSSRRMSSTIFTACRIRWGTTRTRSSRRSISARSTSAAREAGTSGFTYGLLYGTEVETAARCAAALPGAWHDLRRALRPLWTDGT